MSLLKKVSKILSIGFLSLIIIFMAIAMFNNLTASPEQKAEWKSRHLAEKKERDAEKLEQRKIDLAKNQAEKAEKEKQQAAQALIDKQKEKERLVAEQKEKEQKALDDFQKELPEKEFLAGICSQTYISNLLEPNPSKFPSKNATYEAERAVFRISSYVDSKNAFGGNVRQSYYCEISGVDLETTTCAKHDCKWQ